MLEFHSYHLTGRPESIGSHPADRPPRYPHPDSRKSSVPAEADIRNREILRSIAPAFADLPPQRLATRNEPVTSKLHARSGVLFHATLSFYVSDLEYEVFAVPADSSWSSTQLEAIRQRNLRRRADRLNPVGRHGPCVIEGWAITRVWLGGHLADEA